MEEKLNTIGEDHMFRAKQVRDELREDSHRRMVMRLEMMKHNIKLHGTIREVPDSIDPDETAPSA